MRKLFYVLLAALLVTSCSDKIEAEGPVTTDEISVSADIAAISVESSMKLLLSDEVEEGEINIITNENIHSYINVEKSNNQITIQLDNNNYKGLEIKVVASSKQFSNIKASGASEVTISGEDLFFNSYSLSLKGASKVNVGSALSVDVCNILASGASSIKGDDFIANSLNVDLSGESSVMMGVNNSISGKLSGASKIKYWGEATVSAQCTGASEVKKQN